MLSESIKMPSKICKQGSANQMKSCQTPFKIIKATSLSEIVPKASSISILGDETQYLPQWCKETNEQVTYPVSLI